jgi:hypothetical protein
LALVKQKNPGMIVGTLGMILPPKNKEKQNVSNDIIPLLESPEKLPSSLMRVFAHVIIIAAPGSEALPANAAGEGPLAGVLPNVLHETVRVNRLVRTPRAEEELQRGRKRRSAPDSRVSRTPKLDRLDRIWMDRTKFGASTDGKFSPTVIFSFHLLSEYEKSFISMIQAICGNILPPITYYWTVPL